MRRIVVVTRFLLGLYAILAIVSAGLAVGSALRGQYGSAALNAALALVWLVLFRRLRRRGLATGPGGRRG
jgi:hypothetical protein